MGAEHERLKEILATAAGIEAPDARAAYLETACQGDATLRRQVEGLLSAHEQASEFLEQSVLQPFEEPIGVGPGSVVGRYKLLQEIGAGGFGRVFMAEQQAPVQRKVALKIVKAGMDTREVIGRFEAERQALALMEHPNIARVLDAGATESGRPYFVMELVNGIPITNYCDQYLLSTEARLQLFMKVCQAVQHAHQKGIIHRDLKPTNILVTLIDGEPVPKIIDFGVAKALGHKLTEKTLFTAFQQMIGTPAYMSPEQAALSGVDVDTRSDIYSLGVLLYELLTGVTPFDQEILHRAALDEIRRLIRETEPPKPSTRLQALGEKLTEVAQHRHTEPTALARLVHGDLDWIVMKALEKDRARRYDTASSLVQDIQHHLNHLPVVAGPPGVLYRTRKFVRRHRVGVATATALATALALGLVVSLIAFSRARQERDRARVAESKAETEQAISAAVNDFLLEDLLRQASPNVQADREVKLRTLLDRATANVETRFAGKPLVEAKIRETLGSVYESLGQYTNARIHLDRALQIDTERFGPEDPRTLKARRATLGLMRKAGKVQAGAKLAEELVAVERRVQGPEHLETLESVQLLASFYMDLNKLKEAEELTRQVVTLRRRIQGPEHRETLTAINRLGTICFAQTYASEPGKTAEARRLFEEALAASPRAWGPEHPETINAMHNVATVLAAEGHTLEAQRRLAETVQLSTRVLGREHPATLKAMYNLALTYQNTGEFKEALALYEDLAALQRQVLGPEHADTLQTMVNMGVVLLNERRLAEADKLFDQVYVGRKRSLGPKHLKTMHALMAKGMLGRAYLDHGQPAEAQKVLEQTLALQRETLGSNHPNALDTMKDLANALAAQDKAASARKIRREIITSGESGLASWAPDSTEALEVQDALATAYRDLGMPDQAQKLFENLWSARIRLQGREHPRAQFALMGLGVTCAAAGKLDEAKKLFGELLPDQVRFQGPSGQETLATLRWLASLATAMGDWPAALEHCRNWSAAATNDLGAVRLYALVARLAGQDQTCRAQCELLLTRAAALTNEPGAASLAAGTCLLAAEFAPDLSSALRLAERALVRETSAGLTNGPSNGPGALENTPEATMRLKLLEAIAEYRAGHHAKAVSCLKPLAHADQDRGLLALYFLSLACQELNQPEEAKACLLAADRRLDALLHTGVLCFFRDSLADVDDLSDVLVVRSEAERKILGRQATVPDAPRLAAARQAWRPVLAMLQQARAHGLDGRWQEAATALDNALQQPAFNWSAASIDLPEFELWMGIALVRAGELQRHARFCRTLAAAVSNCADPDDASVSAAQVCLLPSAPGPELLLLASNLLAQAESPFEGEAIPGQRALTQGLLAYRDGRYADAVPLLRQISGCTNLQLRATAQVLHALAAKQLGQKTEAERLWREVMSLLPEASESGETPERFPDLQVLLLLADEGDKSFRVAPTSGEL